MSLKFCNGGSKVKFNKDNECCVPYCGATRESNPTLPFYTLPSDATLRQEWLDIIQIGNRTLSDWEKSNVPLVVCSRHFKPHDGGMKLVIDKAYQVCAGTSRSAIENDESIESAAINSLAAITQAHDNWVAFLKEKYTGIDIKCSNNIQCRTCCRFSVQAIGIYEECNLPLNLDYLINNFLPIKVKPTDMKSLNICVDCIFKLKKFVDFFNSCDRNDKLTKELDKKKMNQHQLNLNKNNSMNNEVIVLSSDSESEGSDLNMYEPNREISLIPPDTEEKLIRKISRKHNIKLLVATTPSSAQNMESPTNNSRVSTTSKLVDIEFSVTYLINNGFKQINEIRVNASHVNIFPQQTIKYIFKVIKSTIKKQCDLHNSKMAPVPMPQLHWNRLPNKPMQIRIDSNIPDGNIN